MKHGIIFSLLFFLFLPLVFSETQIFSGKVRTDTDKSIENGLFRFVYEEISSKVFVQTPATNLIVDRGDCKSNSVYKVCINGVNFTYKNITNDHYYYDVDTTIYNIVGTLSSSIALSPMSVLQDEPAQFTVIISNPTDFDFTGVSYDVDLSKFFVSDVIGCDYENKHLMWKGTIKSKFDKICTGSLRAENDGTYKISGNLTYYNIFDVMKSNINTAAITVLPRQLKVVQLTDNYIEIGQPFFINATLQNINSDNKIDVHEVIELGDGMELIRKVYGLSRDYNVLTYDKTLEPGSSDDYSVYLKSSSPGLNVIKHKFDYTIKNIKYSFENYTYLNVIEPKPLINMTVYPENATSGGSFVVLVKIKNPSRISDITGIKAKLEVSYNGDVIQNMDKLKANQSYVILSNTFAVPKKEDLSHDLNNNINLNLNIYYDNIYGNKAVAGLNKSLIITDIEPIKQQNKTEQSNITSQNKTMQVNEATEPENNHNLNNNLTNILPSSSTTTTINKPIIIDKEAQKLSLFDKNNLIITSVFIIVFIALFIIYHIRKKKDGILGVV